jgi:hypothetical protein
VISIVDTHDRGPMPPSGLEASTSATARANGEGRLRLIAVLYGWQPVSPLVKRSNRLSCCA